MRHSSDDRLDGVETVTVDWESFKKALKRSYLDPSFTDTDFKYRLRLTPPFESEMKAEYDQCRLGSHIRYEDSARPWTFNPQQVIESSETGFRGLPRWPTERNVKQALADDKIEDIGGVDKAVAESRELFWNAVRHAMPETIDLIQFSPVETHTVALEVTDE
jgi:hypothetical protein